ncbi:branched-chain amino acid ABC transporter permease [Microbacterium sp. KHB019]|uniref:branched-chain amino acid ABC transporter permease n=1 Tax=Microbacterium sp. KHB019 TaxID=3129770 RepID=UPI0030793E53
MSNIRSTLPQVEIRPSDARASGWFGPGRRARLIGFAVLAVVVVLYPLLAPASRWIDAANMVMIAAVGAIALNILIGVAGQFSMGSAAFMAIGSFTASIITTQFVELPFLLTLLVGAVAGGIAAVFVGFIALRIRGFYLALATIALHYIVIFVFQRIQEGTVGITGYLMPSADVFGFGLVRATDWYPVLVVILTLIAIGAHNLMRGRTGRSFRAVKDRDIAAAILGVNVTRTKMIAFIVTSMIIGFQGSLFAYYVGVVTYEAFHLDVAVQYIAMIMIGGIATVSGSILGAIFVIALPYIVEAIVPALPSWFPFSDLIERNLFSVQLVIYGLVIIIFILRVPRGMSYGFARLGRSIAALARRTITKSPTQGGAR